MNSHDDSSIKEMERNKAPWGEVTLVGLGRLGLRTALCLMQAHRGGPEKIIAIDGQKVSSDDLIFRMMGAGIGDNKVTFLEKFAGKGYSKEISGIPSYVTDINAKDLIAGDVVCIEIAGGDTLPVTASIIKHAQKIGASTISTMGVFGVDDAKVISVRIDEADRNNPIVAFLQNEGIRNHILIGTGKLIRDWEPVIPPVLDRISHVMASEILRELWKRKKTSLIQYHK
jgi:predicted ThiF/HesA family dinucleotide-utilizing enzyme